MAVRGVVALGRRWLTTRPETAQEILARRGITATDIEAIVYLWLESRGYKQGVNMSFQSSLFGGRGWSGGLIADFILYHPSIMALWVMGEYWHRDPIQQDKDEFNEAKMEAIGIEVIKVPEKYIRANIDAVMEDAIKGIEWGE